MRRLVWCPDCRRGQIAEDYRCPVCGLSFDDVEASRDDARRGREQR